MKIKTSELTGAALDWAAALALGRKTFGVPYSTNWQESGPIIEREKIRWNESGGDYYAWAGGHKWIDPLHEPMLEGHPGIKWGGFAYGSTLLEAAMRCFVASKLGDEVEIPDELV